MDVSQGLLQSLLQSINDYLIIKDKDGTILYYNKVHPTFLCLGNGIFYDQEQHFYTYETSKTIFQGKEYQMEQFKDITDLYREMKELETDHTTGLPNKKRLFAELNALNKKKTKYHIAMIDVDDFKAVNDTFGHPFGDSILRTIADTFQYYITNSTFVGTGKEFVGRYGGEEFTMIFREEELETVLEKLDFLRKQIIQNIAYRFNKTLVTISIGLASSHDFTTDSLGQLAEADRILYYVKQHGKNAVGYQNQITKEIELYEEQQVEVKKEKKFTI